jgi:adenosylcobinamide kinase / adenosylcobinamide-phosphate guanylyltransferase
MIHLILGGARSGKSRLALAQAELLASAGQRRRKYLIATATALDAEMQQRIQRHQAERGDDWLVAEIPLALAACLRQSFEDVRPVILVDCLTLWLNNQLYQDPGQDFSHLLADLIDALQHCPADVLLVANEVGLGVIPMGEVSRTFVDQAGWLNQAIAAIADKVTFVVAGLPVTLKNTTGTHD